MNDKASTYKRVKHKTVKEWSTTLIEVNNDGFCIGVETRHNPKFNRKADGITHHHNNY